MAGPRTESPDGAVLARAREGDERAFARLLAPWRAPLFAYLRRSAPDRSAAEDLLQETLIRVWRGLAEYDDQGRFGAWAFTIARRVAIDAARAFDRRPDLVPEAEAPEPAAPANPEADVLAGELEAILLATVDGLPEEQREVLILRQHGGLGFKEIAAITNAPLSTVLSRMHYAVTKLRKVVRSWNEG